MAQDRRVIFRHLVRTNGSSSAVKSAVEMLSTASRSAGYIDRDLRTRHFLRYRGSCSSRRRHEKTQAVAFTNETQASRALVDWVREAGGVVAGLAVHRTEDEGWFLKAEDDITSGTRLIRLPASCQLSYSTEADDRKLIEMIREVSDEFWAGKLCLKLLVERLKGENSRFWPYLQCLPTGVAGIPLFFSSKAVDSLQYVPIIAQIKKRCRWLMSLSERDRKQLSQLSNNSSVIPDANLLGWALAIVSSRGFRVYGNERPASMLPLIDLCNHSFNPNCKVSISQSKGGSLELIALDSIPKGEALLISYGDLNNDDLLLDYGFIIKGNPYDSVQLAFEPDAISLLRTSEGTATKGGGVEHNPKALKEWKNQMLNRLELIGPCSKPFVNVGRGGERILDKRFIGGVRILTSKSILAETSMEDWCSFDHALEPEHDLEALRIIAKMLVFALSNLPHDIDSDQKLLATGQISESDECLAVAFRVEKKQVLLGAIRHIASRIREIKDKE